ncbi:(2Fe-2S)-binding protein [Merdimmobilis hominis]|jgi:Fe-S-cluster-containing hydrogenase component 2|uniref:(2Fe-2S)-binding protein n=1 Tax=Merdimmobilis hominis TaxID=2897707 RepID=UPI0008F93265|nr:(2Fe-2S)-binding protein [Merdimmobilis hominis]PWL61468.1 MAG: (2Fe-2S)-binding protein [Oscillospiraceae bacterium]
MPNSHAMEVEQKVRERLPSPERRKQGPYAVFECFQSIPCNPCYTACKFGAVKPLTDINDLPEVYYDKCTGCGLCMTACPGLAVFVIDETYSEDKTVVRIPYEFLPLPQVGDTVDAVDRDGQVVGKAQVVKVQKFPNKTSIVSLAVDNSLAQTVRGMKLAVTEGNGAFSAPRCKGCGESIVCRCEDISMEELLKTIGDGNLTLNEVKLATRASMGPCQGKTCISLIMKELSTAAGKPVEELGGPRYRVPVKPVTIGAIRGDRSK